MDTASHSKQLIPRAVLFGNPVRANPRLSPDGRRMAYLAPVNGVLNVWVGTVGKEDAVPVTDDRDRGVRAYFWGHDRTHLLYLQDVGGDENWSLYAVNLETKATRCLTPFKEVQVQILDHDKRFPHTVLIGMNRDDARLHDVYRLDLRSGELELAAKNPGQVMDWVTDAEFKVRGAAVARSDGGIDLQVRDSEQGPWRTIITWSGEDTLTSRPVGFSLDGASLYLVNSQGANAGRLVALDLATGRSTDLAGDAEYDVAGILMHPDTRVVQAVSFNKDRREWLVLDDAIRADVAALARLGRGDAAIEDRTDADDRWLIALNSDTSPVSYFAYDRAGRKGTFLFHTRPALTQYTLAPMEPVAFTSRDGLTVHGYLTRPVGAGKERLPMVLNVHGGPWARDSWGYHPEAQWLANRGYACLQVNYRGSTGYGKRFLNAGDREWGGRMHDDLVDAVNWAIAEGVADPERVAIYGGSYGGYAALSGATFTPDLFRCAIALVGPSNLITFINTIPPYWSTFLAMMHQRVGNPETDAEFLTARSPLSAVDRIRIPMLIGQGANDPRVKQAESEQIVEAMRRKGIDHEYMLFPDEGHGFAKPDNRMRFYAAVERFLARHLGGQSEG